MKRPPRQLRRCKQCGRELHIFSGNQVTKCGNCQERIPSIHLKATGGFHYTVCQVALFVERIPVATDNKNAVDCDRCLEYIYPSLSITLVRIPSVRPPYSIRHASYIAELTLHGILPEYPRVLQGSSMLSLTPLTHLACLS